MAKLEHLKFDSGVFNQKMGKIVLAHKGSYESFAEEIEEITKRGQDQGYKHLSCRTDSSHLAAIRSLEANGFHLVDILITFSYDLNDYDKGEKEVSIAGEADLKPLKRMAESSFTQDRFHNDPTLPKKLSDKLYGLWLENCFKGRSEAVIVYRQNGNPIGFITCNRDKKDRETGVIDLVAVSKGSQGMGVGLKIVENALYWFKNNGFKRVTVGTQINNVPAVRIYEKAGFRTISSSVTYHKVL
jgi:ribosomal protein S18 acetylase RimI-like enzyme